VAVGLLEFEDGLVVVDVCVGVGLGAGVWLELGGVVGSGFGCTGTGVVVTVVGSDFGWAVDSGFVWFDEAGSDFVKWEGPARFRLLGDRLPGDGFAVTVANTEAPGPCGIRGDAGGAHGRTGPRPGREPGVGVDGVEGFVLSAI